MIYSSRLTKKPETEPTISLLKLVMLVGMKREVEEEKTFIIFLTWYCVRSVSDLHYKQFKSLSLVCLYILDPGIKCLMV